MGNSSDRTNRLVRYVAIGAIALLIGANDTHADLVVDGYSSATAGRYDRFENDGSFLGSGFDWSGIGRVSSGGSDENLGRWATMISPTYFVSATHFAPQVGSTVTFYESNDFTGATESRTVASGSQIDGSDLWLGKLSAAVTPDIGIFPILDLDILAGLSLVVVGQDGSNQQRFGLNQVTADLDNFSDADLSGGTVEGDVFLFDFDPSGGLGDDESRVAGGDSGAPSFVITPSGPALVGVHWFNYIDGDELVGGQGSGDTKVTAYGSHLNAAMVGESFTLVSVPEPRACLMLVCVGLVQQTLLWKRVRRCTIGSYRLDCKRC